jgi:hypothetical protein
LTDCADVKGKDTAAKSIKRPSGIDTCGDEQLTYPQSRCIAACHNAERGAVVRTGQLGADCRLNRPLVLAI